MEGPHQYKAPLGARYSQEYVERSQSKSDSPRLRRRIGAYAKNNLSIYGSQCWSALEERLGAAGYGGAYSHFRVQSFFEQSGFFDFADGITIVYDAMVEAYKKERYTSISHAAQSWLKFCQDSFIEENLAYSVDRNAVVSPQIDVEFNNLANSTLDGLNDPRFGAVVSEIEASIAKLRNLRPDTKSSVREIFEAFETAAKVVFSDRVPRLNRNIILQVIRPYASKLADNEPEREAVAKICEGISNWADACHIYRHGQEIDERSPPSFRTAVVLVTSGLNYMRWFVELVSKNEQPSLDEVQTQILDTAPEQGRI